MTDPVTLLAATDAVAEFLGMPKWDRERPAKGDRAWLYVESNRLKYALGWFLDYAPGRVVPAVLACRVCHISRSNETRWFATRSEAVEWLENGYGPAMTQIAEAALAGINVALQHYGPGATRQDELIAVIRRGIERGKRSAETAAAAAALANKTIVHFRQPRATRRAARA